MASLKEVKSRITSVISTQQITKAMKMVAAAKLKRAQDNIIKMRPYAASLNGIMSNLTSGQGSDTESPYGVERPVKKVLLIPITSDKGLCGAFNSTVNKATLRRIEEVKIEFPELISVEILPLGKKGFDFFKKKELPLNADHYTIFSNLDFAHAEAVSEYLMHAFINGSYDRVELIFNEFKNVANQNLIVEQLLPVKQAENTTSSSSQTDYIFEPSKKEIYKDLIPKSIKIQVFKALLESFAGEQGARMTAMSKATDNAGDLLKELRLTYNRTRQAAITKEILEIVAGAEALN